MAAIGVFLRQRDPQTVFSAGDPQVVRDFVSQVEITREGYWVYLPGCVMESSIRKKAMEKSAGSRGFIEPQSIKDLQVEVVKAIATKILQHYRLMNVVLPEFISTCNSHRTISAK